MRSALWCFSLLFVFITGPFGGNAFGESMPVMEGPSILPADNTRSTAVDQVSIARNASSYAIAIPSGAGGHPDSGEVKQPKPSFWQWISGKKVDCSSGVCIVK